MYTTSYAMQCVIFSVDQMYPVLSMLDQEGSDASDADNDIEAGGSGGTSGQLPVLIRERDVVYQYCRVTLYRRLLQVLVER